MRKIDRKFFSGYYLSSDGKTLFGTCPYHIYQQGKIGEAFLVYCLFSELLLNDEPGGKNQESADMCGIEGDKYKAKLVDIEKTFKNVTKYTEKVIEKDRQEGRKDEKILEDRAFIIDSAFVGKTFAEVCETYPVIYTETTDDEGNAVQSANHKKFKEETI